MITFAAFNDLPGIRHAFFSREGGVSEGLYASLNCGFGSNDDPGAVARNRELAMERLGTPGIPLITAYQKHTSDVVTVTAPWAPDEAPIADGMVTDKHGIALGILTADCAPVLLADGENGVIGAAHAGWRGAKGGVVEATIEAMIDLGAEPKNIVAAIGPCIAQRSYEVSDDFAPPFVDEDAANAALFAEGKREGHLMFDLAGYVWRRLSRYALRHVVRSPCDTCGEEERFFSYRRSVLKGESDYGRELSAIVIDG